MTSAVCCPGGRCWIAVSSASSTVSRATSTSSGRSSGASAASGRSSSDASVPSRRLRMSKHALVAIRYSHPRAEPEPCVRRERHARRSVSCSASSPSAGEPVRRTQWRCSSSRGRSSVVAKSGSTGTPAMLASERGKGKGQSCMAVVHEPHDRVWPPRHTRSMSGEVLAFPQAPDGVEVRHLRAFVTVAEELSFSRAAARLYISQPALSRQIRALERLVGCQLLRRSTHRVELTVAGSALVDRARRLLADLDEAISTTQSVGGELANRMATMWAPVLDVVTADRDIEEMRTAYEAFLAQSPVPDGVAVRPALAGGVSSLAITPAEGDQGTVILYLHGGGFTIGSAYGYRPLAGALVAAAGVGALVLDFRLAPEHPFPAAVEDAVNAYRWLAAQRGADEIVLVGDSAGAGLACSLMLTLREQGEPQPAGAALLCPGGGPPGGTLPAGGTEPEPAVLEQPQRAADASLPGPPPDDPIVNALVAALSGLPPLLVQAATGDLIRPDAEAFAERAKAHGVDARLELYPADTHVFHVFWSFLPEAADALASAGA